MQEQPCVSGGRGGHDAPDPGAGNVERLPYMPPAGCRQARKARLAMATKQAWHSTALPPQATATVPYCGVDPCLLACQQAR